MLADVENADPLGDAAQRRGHLLAMLAAFGVIVGKHHDIGTAEILGIFGPPFLDTARIRRGREPDGAKVVDVLLALGDVDGLPGGNRLHELGQQIGEPANVPQLPAPAAAVRPALAEILRLEAHNLEPQYAALVRVIVGLNDPGFGTADDLWRPEQAFAQ